MRSDSALSGRFAAPLLALGSAVIVAATVYFVLLGCGSATSVKREPRVLVPNATPSPMPTASLDSDGDGIPDVQDRCPAVPGLANNYGCPVVATPTPTPTPAPTPTPTPTPGRTVIVAVFDVEDSSGKLDAKTLNQITEYLATKVTELCGYRVIPRNQLKARLAQEKREGYKSCYEASCQIDLGKALAAQKTLATKLLQVGSSCAISTTLLDLKTETAEKATSTRTNCSENGLLDGMEKIAQQLAAAKSF